MKPNGKILDLHGRPANTVKIVMHVSPDVARAIAGDHAGRDREREQNVTRAIEILGTVAALLKRLGLVEGRELVRFTPQELLDAAPLAAQLGRTVDVATGELVLFDNRVPAPELVPTEPLPEAG